jgi:anti-anti-sigma regulatory factor
MNFTRQQRVASSHVMRTGYIDSEPTSAGAGAKGAAAGARETAAPQVGTAAPGCDFAVALEWRGSSTAVLLLAGELDLYRAPAIEKVLTEAIGLELHKDGQPGDGRETPAEKARHLAVDLRSVTFVDSTTLGLLLAASRHQQARGGTLLVVVGPQTPMTAFEVTGCDRLLAIRRGDDRSRQVHQSGPAPLLAMTGGGELAIAGRRALPTEKATQIAQSLPPGKSDAVETLLTGGGIDGRRNSHR